MDMFKKNIEQRLKKMKCFIQKNNQSKYTKKNQLQNKNLTGKLEPFSIKLYMVITIIEMLKVKRRNDSSNNFL